MKSYGGMKVELHQFLTKALAAGEWFASRPAALSPGKQLPGGWADPKDGVDVTERKSLAPPRNLTPILQASSS
jgi:hypothetical protein